MTNRNDLSSLVISTITICALVFSGCSTSSDNGSENEDSNSVSFSSGDIPPGESYSYTFTEEGEVEYYCQIHAPDMQGKINVTSNAEAVERDSVSMENDQFHPENLSIAPNTEVVWTNNENHTHNIQSGNPSSSDGGGGDDGGPGY